VPLWADAAVMSASDLSHLLVYCHEPDHFSFDMCLNTWCNRFLMVDLDAMLFGFDAVSTGHFVLI
jgi:hypothetical protein